MANSEDFTTALRGLIKQEIRNIHTALPATIINVRGMDVDVQPLVQLYQNGNHRKLPIIYSVPYQCPQTINGGLRWNPTIGENVLVMCCEMSIDNLMEGDGKTVVKSEDGRSFDLSDAVVINGFLNSTQNLPVDPTVGVELTYGEQTVTIKKNGDIVLGSGVAQSLLTEAFKTALETHTHPVVPPVPPATIPVITGFPTIAPETVIPYTTRKVTGE